MWPTGSMQPLIPAPLGRRLQSFIQEPGSAASRPWYVFPCRGSLLHGLLVGDLAKDNVNSNGVAVQAVAAMGAACNFALSVQAGMASPAVLIT